MMVFQSCTDQNALSRHNRGVVSEIAVVPAGVHPWVAGCIWPRLIPDLAFQSASTLSATVDPICSV